MIEHRLDTVHSILYVRPKSALEPGDFAQLARTVDPFIEQTGNLAGLVIETKTFPGWNSLGAVAAHFRFVRDHHRRIKKVALITDAALVALRVGDDQALSRRGARGGGAVDQEAGSLILNTS